MHAWAGPAQRDRITALIFMPRERAGNNNPDVALKQQEISTLRKKLGDREKHHSETSQQHRDRIRLRLIQRKEAKGGDTGDEAAFDSWFIIAQGLIGLAFVILFITKILI